MIRRIPISRALLAAALFAAACNDSPTDAVRPGSYDATRLGAPAWADTFEPEAVDGTRVVGAATTGGRSLAVLWMAGTFSRVGPEPAAGCDSRATAVSGTVIVGEVTCGTDAYGWATTLSGRAIAGPHTFADVNASGTIVGSRAGPEAARRAFILRNGQVTELLPPGATGSEAAGISDEGDVAVTAYAACGDEGCEESYVAVWRNGTWTTVPLPRGASRAVAYAVSSAGHVLGRGMGRQDPLFVWQRDEDLQGLPVVPGTRVEVNGISELGQVVGAGVRPDFPAQPTHGIVWGGEREYYLSDRIRGEDGDSWLIDAALAIDDDGRIAALGTHERTGESAALLLVPSRLD